MMCIYLTAIELTPVAVVQYTFTQKQYTEQHNETERTERNYITIRILKITKEHIT
jgi:hypothetical protein